MPLKTEFIRLSSYGSATVSSGKVNAVDISLPDLNDKNVLIVEDIIDTGHTAQFLTNFINSNFKVKSYKFIALLDKRCKRQVAINPDMYGFEVEDKFLIGYGLDYDGHFRNLRYVGYIEN
jgi:hypoxanthine phosphoribosyltransferase